MMILNATDNSNRGIMFAPDEKEARINVYFVKKDPQTQEVSQKKLIFTLDVDPKQLDNCLIYNNNRNLKIFKNGHYSFDCTIEREIFSLHEFYAKSLSLKDWGIDIKNKKRLSSDFYYSMNSGEAVSVLYQSVLVGGAFGFKRPLIIRHKVPARNQSDKFTLTLLDLPDKREFLLQYPYLTYTFQTDNKGLIQKAQKIDQSVVGKTQYTDINDPEMAQKIFFDALDRVDSDLKEKLSGLIPIAYKNYKFKPSELVSQHVSKLSYEDESQNPRERSYGFIETLGIFYQYLSNFFNSQDRNKRRKEVLGKWQQKKASQDLLTFIRSEQTK